MSDQNEIDVVSESEAIVIEGQTDNAFGEQDVDPAGGAQADSSIPTTDETASDSGDGSADEDTAVEQPALSPRDEAIYTIRLLTAVAVGGVVEGADQLLTRLNQYREEMLVTMDERDEEGEIDIDEDELDLLRYATIGLIFETENMIGRSLELAYKTLETSVNVTDKVTKPFRDFFLFRPITKRVEKRVDNMADRGQDSISRWIEIGRYVEPRGRMLAKTTYEEVVDEFIQRLADNPEIEALVAQQSLSLAAGVRDEVRERTVTSDNVLEDIARRILRREPRPELAEPPPEVQRWAGLSVEDIKEREIEQLDEQRTDSTE